MFASRSLAARIERAEARLTRSVGELLQAREPKTWMAEVGEGVGVATVEDSPFEKVIGAGFAEGDFAAFLCFEEGAQSRGRKVRVELSTLADPSFGRELTSRGYALEGFENVLGRGLAGHTTKAPAPIEVHEIARAELETWIDTVVDAFAEPDMGADAGTGAPEAFPREPLTAVMRDMAALPGFAAFLARREGVIAGGASIRVHDGIAQLTGAATLRAHRRRGVQSALLEHRLAWARARGCDIAVVTTRPGSKSQENVMRLGFTLLYPRAVLVKV
jgi:GNAT superfamily N-acetyltransferase